MLPDMLLTVGDIHSQIAHSPLKEQVSTLAQDRADSAGAAPHMPSVSQSPPARPRRDVEAINKTYESVKLLHARAGTSEITSEMRSAQESLLQQTELLLPVERRSPAKDAHLGSTRKLVEGQNKDLRAYE